LAHIDDAEGPAGQHHTRKRRAVVNGQCIDRVAILSLGTGDEPPVERIRQSE
jgi:hypothetical protein